MRMVYKIRNVVFLILVSTHTGYLQRCNKDDKTLTRANAIQSLMLDDYLSFLDCNSDYGYASWSIYAAKCFRNISCVGIHKIDPPSLCVLSDNPQNETIQMDYLWLIVSELEKFEGKS